MSGVKFIHLIRVSKLPNIIISLADWRCLHYETMILQALQDMYLVVLLLYIFIIISVLN